MSRAKPGLASLVGVCLMALALLLRVNPVEVSVMPDWLTGTQLGIWLFWFLVIACVPAWVLSGSLSLVVPNLPSSGVIAIGIMLVFQALLYYAFALLAQRVMGRLRRTPGPGARGPG